MRASSSRYYTSRSRNEMSRFYACPLFYSGPCTLRGGSLIQKYSQHEYENDEED